VIMTLNLNSYVILIEDSSPLSIFVLYFTSVIDLLWLRHYATSLKVTGLIPDGVNGIFH
jgi:hypothetical protein